MMRPRTSFSEKTLRHDASRATFRSRPYDIQNLYVSLRQWRIFHAVIDCGGFAEAAKSLHLSQSTISYTVAKLQEQIGTPLLRIEGRKSTLTPEGRALLDRSRHVLSEAIELETFARHLGQGWGGELRLVVDPNFPSSLLLRALSAFSQGKGMPYVKLTEVASMHAEDVLRDLNIDLAISERVPLGFLGEPLVEIEYIPVARPDHPLMRLGREASVTDLAQQVRIDIGQGGERDRPGGTRQMRRWTMSNLDTAVDAVCEGFGYALLPEHRIRKWLDQGALARIPFGDKREHKVMLYLIHGKPWTSSPAAGQLADMLRNEAATLRGQDQAEAAG